MEIEGQHRFAADRALVWSALNDPEILAACIPGCESFTATAPDTFTAVVAVRVGSLAARFSGTVTLSDITETEGYTLTGQGNGSVAGFARGAARVRIEEDGGETLLSWLVNVQIGGKLASLGGRLIHGFAAKTATEFCTRLQQRLCANGVIGGGN